METVLLLWRMLLLGVLLHFGLFTHGRKLRRSKRGWLSGKPAGVQCAFNPCSVPDFCGEGRSCSMDENCLHSCNCDENSNHEQCIIEKFSTTPKLVECTFNPCSSPAFGCGEGRQCVLGEFCRPECKCLDSTTHPLCIGEITDTTESVDLEPVENVCISGEPSCLHGDCIEQTKGGYRCQCEKGWSGETCDVSQCIKQCPENSYCHFVTLEVQLCLASSEPTETEHVTRDDIDVCSDDNTVRTKSEQNCTTDMDCVYGKCGFIGSDEVCICDKGATGADCSVKCCLDCEEDENCTYIDDIGETCVCNRNDTGVNCTMDEYFDFLNGTEAATEQPVWHYWVVGSCAFVLLLLICLVIVVPYILWKHRVILVMKVVHYFQEYEDDDDREWDVFISYKSTTSDESFVVETLFPKLEKELGFKVNVHFRDFVAGETISNNIISAVQGSRRTILIISPAYVTSEFTQFEYQVAQQEMLKRKHRIIPILLEDISSCKETMDPMLKVILGSVTYIEWPKVENEKKLDKFWKRIELSMPKKKTRSVDSSTQPALTNGVCKSSKPNTTESTSNKPRSQNGSTDGNIYTVIDESKLNNEEVYDTLNESEMLTQVMKRQSEAEKKSKQDEFLNVLKVDL
ncbi:Toll-like receptor [Mactra antiquata]